MDLYADEWQTFRRVTLPLVAPGIVAAALLAFSLSFDDFIITNFNSGNGHTFPMFVWVLRRARHPRAGQRHRHGDVLPRAASLVLVGQAGAPAGSGRRPDACHDRRRRRRQPPSPTCGTCRTGWTARQPRTGRR